MNMFKIISFYEKVFLVPLSFCLWKLVPRLHLPLVGKEFCNCFANSKGKKKTFVRICFNLSNSFLKSSLSAYDFSRTFPKTAPVIQLYPFNSLFLSLLTLSLLVKFGGCHVICLGHAWSLAYTHFIQPIPKTMLTHSTNRLLSLCNLVMVSLFSFSRWQSPAA